MNELRQFNNECLAAHNGLRKAHNVDELIYDKKLAVASQEYAEKLATSEVLEHSNSTDRANIGENLSFSCKSYPDYQFSGRGCSVNWYSEIKDYNFTNEKQKDGNPATGHFTQVIWKGSKKAGFGRAQSKNDGWYVVGRYYPAGNVLGLYMENIPPLSYSKWEDVPIVLEYLEELRTIEYTKARKHVLDKCTTKTQVSTSGGIKKYTITETFESPIFGNYSASDNFSENPINSPRPKFKNDINENNSNVDDDNDDVSSDEDERNETDDESHTFQVSIQRRHNFYRKKHNMEKLCLSQELSEMAQDWAQALADQNSLGFSNFQYHNSEVGENISSTMERLTATSGETIVDRWYEEHKFYNFDGDSKNFTKFGHFTQLIWKRSRKIGIGFAENCYGQNYFVCLYYPPGNVEEMFCKNVFPPNE